MKPSPRFWIVSFLSCLAMLIGLDMNAWMRGLLASMIFVCGMFFTIDKLEKDNRLK